MGYIDLDEDMLVDEDVTIIDLTTLHKDEIKRHLENLFGLSHVLSVDELLQEIKTYIQ